MVKGVNKTVIEVQNTGSKYFEKIVLYVKPEYGNLSHKQLEKASSEILPVFSQNRQEKTVNALRKRCRKKQKRRIITAVSLCVGVIAAVITAIAVF